MNAQGEVFFTDRGTNKIQRIGLDGATGISTIKSAGSRAQIFGSGGRRYGLTGNPGQIIVCDATGKTTAVADGIAGHDLAVGYGGNIYATEPPAADSVEPSKVWLIKPNREKQVVDTGLRYASGITLSPDQSLLYVADARSHWVYSYQVQGDGTLAYKQRYYWLHDARRRRSGLRRRPGRGSRWPPVCRDENGNPSG